MHYCIAFFGLYFIAIIWWIIKGAKLNEWMFPVLFIIVFPCMIVSTFSKSTWFCNFWGWHKAPIEQGFDGCSKNGTCPRCDKSVMQDSQGNWF